LGRIGIGNGRGEKRIVWEEKRRGLGMEENEYWDEKRSIV
jgi:hypothetical protein